MGASLERDNLDSFDYRKGLDFKLRLGIYR